MPRRQLILAVLGLVLCLLTAVSPADDRPTIRRSDVVFMYDNPKQYEAYGCTVMGWAGSGDAKHVDEAHAKGVRLFSASVGFRTEGRGVIDFTPDFLDAACRDFSGEPFIVPWLWDHKHKGQPFWWWCTNSPVYRKYLDSRIEKMMKVQVDGLHIDDYTGSAGAVTWRSACFCRYCLAGFRDYLGQNVPKEKLAALGIADLAKFDYRQFLLNRGVKPAEYNNRRSSLPLAAEFLDYQVKSNNAFVAEYRKRAEQYRGRPLALAVNSAANEPAALVIAPHLTYFCCEVDHHASARSVPTHPISIYKLADGLNRPVTSTASGQDWAYVSENKRPGLVRTWVALSYAFGHNLMAPHRQWCYTEKKGTHWYNGPTEEYAYVYRFVRDKALLLDDYEAVAPVAVVYDNAARRKGLANIEPICAALAAKNVPFTVAVAGDDWLDYRLDANRLSQFKAVIVAKDFDRSPMDQGQKKLLEKVKADGRLLIGQDDAGLAKLLPAPVAVEGSDQITVVPRTNAKKPAAPVVVHLLNRRYDGQKDAMVPQENLVLRLRRDLLPGRTFSKAVLHCPKEPPQALEISGDQDRITVKIPKLTYWGILELGASDAASGAMTIKNVEGGKYYDVSESGRPIFRYNHAAVPAPQGIAANFSRGDYLHPIHGPSEELLTDDFPKDHPHHRGISWSWPVTRWKDEVRDIWACAGVWSRPVTMHQSSVGPHAAVLGAENVWKWGNKESIVREEVLIRTFRQTERGRFIDVEVRLTAIADGVAIGGRPHGGYGGFGLRAQPAKQRKITAYTDPEGTKPRRTWLDYSGVFAGGKGPAGIAILQHPDNPLYPAEYRTYPELNYVMPAFPGEREVLLPKGKTLVLKHRLWIHSGYADEKSLADAWTTYTNPPQANLAK